MVEIHQALSRLSPIDWNDVPPQEELPGFLQECFHAAEMLCNSVPPPASGIVFDVATPLCTEPNTAKSAGEIQPSTARPALLCEEHEHRRRHWGKPIKFNKKDNPLEIALYKMAGNDRHGAWFARYSVLEGMGFTKFKKAMQRELPETLLQTDPPGSGAKRGLGADRRIERKEVQGIGTMEAYQLSALMPSPVSTREFVTLLLTSDEALTEKSASKIQDSKHLPRHFLVVSKPLDHPDAPTRPGFVKGQYESIELLREIPLHAASGTDLDPELNPVEWIMITRSDPGGGIPRFLVDRGTPDAMLTDVKKFLDWACPQERIPDAHDGPTPESHTVEPTDKTGEAQNTPSAVLLQAGALDGGATSVPEHESINEGGIMSSVAAAVKAYTPVAIFRHSQPQESQQSDDDSSDSSSVGSFMSARDLRRLSTALDDRARAAADTGSLASESSSANPPVGDKIHIPSLEREAHKLAKQREKLDLKLSKKRTAEELKFKQSQEKGASERDKAREKMDKEIKKTEERHRKELEKLESRREREARKTEERLKKRVDQNRLSLVARERDEARSQTELIEKEKGILMEQVEVLQRENTALANALGKVGGAELLKSVQEAMAARSRGRSGTNRALDSRTGADND